MADDTLLSPVPLRNQMLERETLLVTRSWAAWFEALWRRNGGAVAPDNGSLASVVADHTVAIAALEAQVADHTTALATLEADIADHTAALAALNAEVATLTADVASVEAAVAGHTTQIATLETQVAGHTAALASLNADVAAHTAAIATLETAVAAHTAFLATITPFARTLLDDADQATMQTTLALVPGTNVQAQDATLQAVATLTTAADTLPYFTAVDVAATTPLTAFARTLLDDVGQAAMQATLGLTTGTFTVTGTGFVTNPTGTARYVRFGPLVTLWLPLLLETSNSTGFTVTGLPAALTPTQAVWDAGILCYDNGALTTNGYLSMAAGDPTLYVSLAPSGSFTPSGTKALFAYWVHYALV